MLNTIHWRNPRLFIPAVAVLVTVLLVGWHWRTRSASAAAAPAQSSRIAVNTATASLADVPVNLQGLGTVQAYFTATVTARVDGQLEQVAFREGQAVRKGALLAQIDPRPYRAALDQVVATRDKDVAQLASALADLERYEILAPQNLASKQQLDQQRALVAQLQAQLQADRATIEGASTQLGYTTIRAPFDGITGIRHVDPGNIVHATDTIGVVVVTQIQPVSCIFTLPEESLQSVKSALSSGPVAVSALSRDGQTELDRGTLALVDNQIDQTTGTVRLKATFPNSREVLWPGQFVNARVLVNTLRDVLTVPTAAVQHGPDGAFTYVVGSNSTVEARPLKLGAESGTLTVVTSGLRDGERVVTSNQYRLQPGAPIRDNTPDVRPGKQEATPAGHRR